MIRDFNDVHVGAELPGVRHHPSNVTLFRFSAATNNAHRIHYDGPFSVSEGLPGPVVQSHLHGCYFSSLLQSWGGPRSRISALAWRPMKPVTAGEVVTVTGRVTQVTRDGGGIPQAVLELMETNGSGEITATATASMRFPRSQEVDYG